MYKRQVWNGVTGFWAAYRQALLFLEVMNVYDGIVIDKLWVGHSRFWVLPGLEEMPFVQTWRQVLRKRSVLALIWTLGAALVLSLIHILPDPGPQRPCGGEVFHCGAPAAGVMIFGIPISIRFG